jgi:hypothetical protein
MSIASSRWMVGVGALVLAGGAQAAPVIFNDFEGGTAGSQWGWRQPSFSSTTSANVAATPAPNLARVTDATTIPQPAAGSTINLGTKVGETQFQFPDTALTRWIRHTTSGAPGVPNPEIDIRQKLLFDVYSSTDVRITLLIRETSNTGGAIGANGGVTGNIEYVGATSFAGAQGGASAGPVGKLVPAGQWTTLEFNIPSEPVASFTGNGVLSNASNTTNPDANNPFMVLEALGVTSTGNAGPITIYYDNFRQEAVPEPAFIGVLGLFAIVGLRRGR